MNSKVKRFKEACEVAERIIPYRYNVPSEDVQTAKDLVFQMAKDGEIDYKLPLEKRQMICDALYCYSRYCKDMVSTNHFGNETGVWEKTGADAEQLLIYLKDTLWGDVVL